MQLFIHPCVIEKALHQDCQWCCFHLRFSPVVSCQDRPILSLRLQMEAVIEKRPGVPQGAILLHIHFAGGSAATKFPVSHLNRNALSLYMQSPNSTSLKARFMGQHGAHLGPKGPRWAPCWPHEPCYLGWLMLLVGTLICAAQNISSALCATSKGV